MVNNSSSSFTNITNKLVNISKEGETRNDLYEVNSIINVIINCITCPLTVLLNVLVIMAVKRRPRLQSNANILLACLAATDVLTGLETQPSFLLYKTFELLGITESETEFFFRSLDRFYTWSDSVFHPSSDHRLSLDSSAQRAGDNGREKKTKTPEQHQHLAGLFSGN
ncbi:hypothetical protein ACROYT_G026534 [Oculina patagonica]